MTDSLRAASLAALLLACSPVVHLGSDDGGEAANADAGIADAGSPDGGQPDAGRGCIVGQNQTCADEPSATFYSTCNPDGTCSCGAEYTKNPLTGKCRWGECSWLTQDCPNPTDGCYPPSTAIGFQCMPEGSLADGWVCTSDRDCAKGSTCVTASAGNPASVCRKMCDLNSGLQPACPGSLKCVAMWQKAGMPGLCLP